MLTSFFADVMPRREGDIYPLFRLKGAHEVMCAGYDQFIQTVEGLQGQTDWYFSTATSSEPKRSKLKTTAHKSLRIDIDAGEDKFDPEKPEKAYETQRDALAALVGFIKETGLIPTYIVSSGEGLHVYWALDEECTDVADWDRAAELLGESCRAKGLYVDASVTTDRVRVLRIPGTIHGKCGKTVEILKATGKKWELSHLTAMLESIAPVPVPRRASAPVGQKSLAAQLAEEAGITPPKYLSSFKKAAEQCGALRDHERERLEYPVWMLTIQSAAISTEGRDLAHEISQRNADQFGGSYDPREVDAKLDSLSADFITCKSFAAVRPACRECEHFGKINGPKELGKLGAKDISMEDAAAAFAAMEEQEVKAGKKEEIADAEDCDLPPDFPTLEERSGSHHAKFIVAHDAGHRMVLKAVVRVQSETADGVIVYKEKYIDLYDTVFYLTAYSPAQENGRDVLLQMAVLDRRTQTWMITPVSPHLVSAGSELLQFLARKGIGIRDTSTQTSALAVQYMKNLYSAIRDKAARPSPRTGMGFHFTNQKELVYIQGRLAINSEGRVVRSLIPKNLENIAGGYICPAVTNIENFESAPPAKIIKALVMGARAHGAAINETYNGHPLYQLASSMLIGSCLMPFVQDDAPNPDVGTMPFGGATLSLYSKDSGYGKSALLKLAGAAYYSSSAPITVTGDSKKGGSVGLRIKRSVQTGHTPVLFDEVTDMSPEDVSALTYMISMGMDKARLLSDGSASQETGTFSLIAGISTNMPQREILRHHNASGDAQQMRLIEINFGVLNINTQVPKGAGTTQAGDSEGFGTWFDREVAPNVGCIGLLLGFMVLKIGHENMFRRMHALKKELSTRLNLTSAERFYGRMVTCLIMSRDLLAGAGVVVPDRELLIDEMRKIIEDVRDQLKGSRRSPLELLALMRQDLWPDMIHTQNDEFPLANKDRAPRITNMPRGAPRGRITDGRKWAVSYEAVKNWCKDNKESMTEIIRAARDNGWLLPGDNGRDYREKLNLTKGLHEVKDLRCRGFIFNTRLMWEEDVDTLKIVGPYEPSEFTVQQQASPV